MKTCTTCHRPVADAHILACVDCGAVLHPRCALARLQATRHTLGVVTVCDPCFVRWMKSTPPILRGYALATVSHLSDAVRS